MSYIYDNSPHNPRNPERRPGRGGGGQRSSGEKGDLWIQVLTRNDADLVALETAFRKKVVAEDVNGYELEIERHPRDTGLRDSVALLHLEVGRPLGAVAHFGGSVAANPQ